VIGNRLQKLAAHGAVDPNTADADAQRRAAKGVVPLALGVLPAAVRDPLTTD